MTVSLLICLAAFLWLLSLLRRDRVSLGLPIAYLFSLLLIHVPGGFAHLVGGGFLANSDLTEISMRFTAIASVCFVVGVRLTRRGTSMIPIRTAADRQQFCVFCLLAGWFFTYALRPLHSIPSVGAVIDESSAIWMLGVLLGLREAFQHSRLRRIAFWLASLMVYPILMLLLGGFLSYGSAATIVVLSALTISTRKYWRVLGGVSVIVFVGLSIFVVYFQHRDAIREQVWGRAPLRMRIDSVLDAAKDFRWFDSNDQAHLNALDQRLNQNYFAGLAAQRIQQGQANYLYGRSVWEGLMSLVPRFLWPDKPVFAGSPGIVAEMTGLELSPTTAFGVGNVMEFQINFGIPGVVGGFLLLGWLIGTLDKKAAIAERSGEFGRTIIYFLPTLPLIQPIGSLVELFSGAAAACIAAFGWDQIWRYRVKKKTKQRGKPQLQAIPAA